ncbi:MAG: 16S rRNA (cytosine(1402)-N(4))-methyltransferase RsmH [Ktedonobacteraceae bacterium]
MVYRFMEHSQHVPVLLDAVLQFLQPRSGGLYIDGTLGGGGHTAAILAQSAPNGRVLGIDTDEQALQRVQARLPDFVDSGRLVLAHGNFAAMGRIANDNGFIAVQGVLLDLGFSSDQMDDPQRGFSFGADGPLDMRLDQSLEISAADLVNDASEQELADIFWKYGEEKRSRQIARRIVREREQRAITRTAQLAKLAAAGVPFKPGTIHPATRIFQALRIAVNQELERLETVLPQILDLLGIPEKDARQEDEGLHGGGRMAIIAFHSLEDRIVKEFMRREATDCLCPPRMPVCICGHKARLRILTAKPLTAGIQETERNPRARSAKLRVAEAVVSS